MAKDRVRRKLRIIIVTATEMIPPEDAAKRIKAGEYPRWKVDYDVASGLRELGHEVHFVGLSDDLGVLRDSLHEIKPHICFNLLEEFDEVALYDQHIVSYLELLKQPYTGCNPRGLTLSHDKILTKKVLSYHRIPTPRFKYFPEGRRFSPPTKLNYPLMVKSATEHASRGISQASFVTSPEKCQERVEFIHQSVGTDAIAEEFIDGREIYISIIGNERLTVFPIAELDFAGLPEGAPKIATERLKFDSDQWDRYGARIHMAELPDQQARKIIDTCKRAYRRLYLSGYARFDVRLREDGKFFLLEANANPSLGFGDEFPETAEAAELPYPALLQKILNLGLSYRALWKQKD